MIRKIIFFAILGGTEEREDSFDSVVLTSTASASISTPSDEAEAIENSISQMMNRYRDNPDILLHLRAAAYDMSLVKTKLKSTETAEMQHDATSNTFSSSTSRCDMLHSSTSAISSSASDSSSSTLADLLQPPTVFSRSVKKRAYKQTNYGVLTSHKLIEECRRVDEEDKQKELDKEQRKVLLNMKKENAQKAKDERQKAADLRKQNIQQKKQEIEAKKAQAKADKEAAAQAGAKRKTKSTKGSSAPKKMTKK